MRSQAKTNGTNAVGRLPLGTRHSTRAKEREQACMTAYAWQHVMCLARFEVAPFGLSAVRWVCGGRVGVRKRRGSK